MNFRQTLPDKVGPSARRVRWSDVRSAVLLPGHWTRFLLMVVVGLSALSLLSQFFKNGVDVRFTGLPTFERWFYVDREMGIPAWLSSILLFLCAERLWLLASASRANGDQSHRRWRLLSVAFVYLSIDELTEIHEQVINPIRESLQLTGPLTFAWVVLAIPLVIIFGLFYLRLVFALPAANRWAIIMSGVIYVGGTVGVEMIGSALFSSLGTEDFLYAIAAGVEEGLEMVGLVLFLGAVSVLLAQATPPPVSPPATSSGELSETSPTA